MKYAIIHYDEIGLKGGNRIHFEQWLVRNIKAKAGSVVESCVRESGHLTAKVNDVEKARKVLAAMPGIAFFSFAERVEIDIDEITKVSLQALKGIKFDTFKVDTRRSDKGFELNSMQVNQIVGEAVVNKYKKKAKMKNPDLTLKIQVSNKFAYISTENIDGVGGLPTQPKNKVVTLLSGGYDSPVAAFLMMKRGCEVVMVHFQNSGQMKNAVQDKIVKLAKQLSNYQVNTRLYIVPFEKLQKEIIMKVKAELRMLVYRKFMIKIASEIAKKERARFLVVGDSLSQVASQTIHNLEATYANSGTNILSPLIGMDKKDIINISKKIGTYKISELPYGDCCSFFVPKHPELKATTRILDMAVEGFDVSSLVENAVEKAKLTVF